MCWDAGVVTVVAARWAHVRKRHRNYRPRSQRFGQMPGNCKTAGVYGLTPFLSAVGELCARRALCVEVAAGVWLLKCWVSRAVPAGHPALYKYGSPHCTIEARVKQRYRLLQVCCMLALRHSLRA